MTPEPWLEHFTAQQLALLEAGSQKTFGKPWRDVEKQISRGGKPTKRMVASLMMVGAVELKKFKETPPDAAEGEGP